jgi:hypothetical protein
MKNIERPEIQELISRYLEEHDFSLYEKLAELGMPNYCDSRLDWFNQEYVEPHHWELWELEAMRNIPKRIVYLERRHDTALPRALQKDDCYTDHGVCTQINFPSLKNEKIDIDEELERNGMKRE